MSESVPEGGDVSVLQRLCLRLDNGTRIGPSRLLGADGAQITKLDYKDGFAKGFVSEEDLKRISEIYGQLHAQREAAAAAPQAKPPLPAPKGAKRKRVPKQQIEIPDDWTQKGMRVVDELLRIPDVKVYFGEPVVPTPTYATDYFNIIKEPMDLSIVRKRLNTGYYVDEAQFKRDMDLIWKNCVKYNGEQNFVAQIAIKTRERTTKLLQDVGLAAALGLGDSRSKRAAATSAAAKFEPEPSPSVDSRQKRGGQKGGGGATASTAAPRKAPAPSPQKRAKAGPKGRGAFPPQLRDALWQGVEHLQEDPNRQAELGRISELLSPYEEEDGIDVEHVPDETLWHLYDVLVAAGMPLQGAPQQGTGLQVTGGGGMDYDDEDTDFEG